MKILKTCITALLFLGICQLTYAQDGESQNNNGGRLSGSLESNANFFMEDTLIGATNIPQYDRQLFGADAWLQLDYSNWGFDMGLRFDLFNNSNLLNPNASYSDQGIGRWYVKKQIDKLGIAAGYLYDQIGSGIIFRAYEQRPLLIDNALYGVKASYQLGENWEVKGFTGKQKRLFETYATTIKGGSIEGYLDGGEESNWSIAPGFGIVHRTYDDALMQTIVNTVNTYSVVDSIAPKYNTYAMTFYNTLTVGPWSWYVEGAYKSRDVFFDAFATKTNRDGSLSLGKLRAETGNIVYTSIGYAQKGLGITMEVKRTENFTFRTDPFVTLNRGMLNFLPPMTRVNTYRLNARYQAATQELGEQAYQLDVRYKFNKHWSFNANFSNITLLDGSWNPFDNGNGLLYRELYTEVMYKYKRLYTVTAGVQMQRYNQEIYEVKPEVPIVETFIPYVDILYKLSRKKALRLELQYMIVGEDEKASASFGENLGQDYGEWLFAQLEFTMAPHWTFTISDMYNVSPGKNSPVDNDNDKLRIHYPRVDVFYTYKANRFSLSYIKQVEGVVCTGGICRLEPAFSGVKLGISSTF